MHHIGLKRMQRLGRVAVYCKDIRDYVNGLTDKFLQTQKSDIKKYWELLKGVACMKYPSLFTSVLFEHFKSLHCPN